MEDSMHLNPRKVIVIRGTNVFNTYEGFKFQSGDWRYDPVTGQTQYKKTKCRKMWPRNMSQKVKAILFMYDIIV